MRCVTVTRLEHSRGCSDFGRGSRENPFWGQGDQFVWPASGLYLNICTHTPFKGFHVRDDGTPVQWPHGRTVRVPPRESDCRGLESRRGCDNDRDDFLESDSIHRFLFGKYTIYTSSDYTSFGISDPWSWECSSPPPRFRVESD